MGNDRKFQCEKFIEFVFRTENIYCRCKKRKHLNTYKILKLLIYVYLHRYMYNYDFKAELINIV